MKKTALTLAAVLLLGACGSAQKPEQPAAQPQTQAQPQVMPPFVFVKDIRGAAQVGKGKVGYRFVLLEPNTDRPAANKPFVLAHQAGRLAFANTQEGAYQGTTDARGLTPVFLFENAVPENGFVLLERVGKGKSGAWLNVNNNGKPIIGVPYTLTVCAGRPYQYSGITNTHGQTVYVAAAQGTQMHITPFTNDAAAQKATLERLCPAAKAPAKKGAKRR